MHQKTRFIYCLPAWLAGMLDVLGSGVCHRIIMGATSFKCISSAEG
jgi:hypothetical protein